MTGTRSLRVQMMFFVAVLVSYLAVVVSIHCHFGLRRDYSAPVPPSLDCEEIDLVGRPKQFGKGFGFYSGSEYCGKGIRRSDGLMEYTCVTPELIMELGLTEGCDNYIDGNRACICKGSDCNQAGQPIPSNWVLLFGIVFSALAWQILE